MHCSNLIFFSKLPFGDQKSQKLMIAKHKYWLTEKNHTLHSIEVCEQIKMEAMQLLQSNLVVHTTSQR